MLRLRHERTPGGNLGDDLVEGHAVVDEEIAGGRAHEHFHARRAFELLEFGDVRHIIPRSADEKREVAEHAVARAANFVGEGFGARRQRLRVGHLKDGRHPACDGRPASGREIFLMLKAGFTEMHLRIDDTGKYVQALRLDDLRGRGRAAEIAEGGDPSAPNCDIADAFSVMVDDRRAPNNDVERLNHLAVLLRLAYEKSPAYVTLPPFATEA